MHERDARTKHPPGPGARRASRALQYPPAGATRTAATVAGAALLAALLSAAGATGAMAPAGRRPATGAETVERGDRIDPIERAQRAKPIERLILSVELVRRGRLDEARALLAAAAAETEEARDKIDGEEERLTFFAARQRIWELYVDVLMRLDERHPGAGYAVAALEVNERRRARGLLDAVAPAASAAPPFTLRQAEAMVGPDGVLLEYALGEERSYLWVVTREGYRVYRLAKRARIEDVAQRLTELSPRASKGAQTEWRCAAADLSALVLTPAGDELRRRRLVVVAADGALLRVPFAALPAPGAGAEAPPLLERHEVVTAPSATVEAGLRQRARAAAPPAGSVLVLADPVYGPSDPRSPRTTAHPARSPLPLDTAWDPARTITTPPRDRSLSSLARLPATHDEAAAILEASPAHSGAVQGLAANRELALSGELRRYRYIDFATHGLVAPRRPADAGLVLSLVDGRGNPVDGILRLPDIERLGLRADLVTLSACGTALGRPLDGEGLVGPAWAFLRAGARGVLASLWSVNDQGAAELMRLFYHALLVERLRPPAALREAQLALRREPRFAAPRHWAAFILLGDWQGGEGDEAVHGGEERAGGGKAPPPR